MWTFDIDHLPGWDNHFANTTSRCTTDENEEEDTSSSESVLCCIRITEDDGMESELTLIAANTYEEIKCITWDLVKQQSSVDNIIKMLISLINNGIPEARSAMLENLIQFWDQRQHLLVIDGVVLMKNRIVIPECLQKEVLPSLHAANQGTLAVNERARQSVYLPGINNDIQSTRDTCAHCNRIAPSQSRLPAFEPHIPTTPFEAICCDYFFHGNWYYLGVADPGADTHRMKGMISYG